eukprot:GFUD01041780.1.p1 GENE.GFUD01041780.1~~GFUD01041780.1.p1  ORF type:complete len:519 (+),score=84.35 GFUD01041780.1:71-1558(+)
MDKYSGLSDFLSKLFNISKEDTRVREVSRDPSLDVDFSDDMFLPPKILSNETNTNTMTGSGDTKSDLSRNSADKIIECKKCGCQKSSREALNLHTCSSVLGRDFSLDLARNGRKRRHSTDGNQKQRFRRIVQMSPDSRPISKKSKKEKLKNLFSCGVCQGCKSKFCGNCSICNTGKMWLCKSKICNKVSNNKARRKRGRKSKKVVVEKSDTFCVVCCFCGFEPKIPSRSELYRHYAAQHYFKELKEEFGDLIVCPQCNLELTHYSENTIVTHFGQKHCEVEKYLPTWAKMSERRGGGRKSSASDARDKYEGIVQFPEIPEGFDPCGPVRAVNGGLVKSGVIDGFEIELDMDSVVATDSSPPNTNSTAIWCKICEKKFTSGEFTLEHMTSKHDMRTCNFESLIRTGYLVLGTTGLPEDIGTRRGNLDCDRFEKDSVMGRNKIVTTGKDVLDKNGNFSKTVLDRIRMDSMSSGYESSVSSSSSSSVAVASVKSLPQS